MSLFDKIKSGIKAFQLSWTDGEELSSSKSPLYDESNWDPYNPDELVQKKGGLKVYKKMMTDDQVKAVMMMKINSVLASGYHIDPASDDPIDVERQKFIEFCLGDGMFNPDDRVVNGFKKSLKKMLSALAFGFSVTEKIYKRFEGGEYAGKIGIKAFKTRPPHSFEFHTDDFNNLIKLRQYQKTTIKDFVEDDLDYFIIYVYDADNTGFDNWYGTSDLRAAYRHWWSKDITIKFRNIYNERFGMGIVVGRYPRGLSQSEQNDLKDLIDNIQAKTGFKLPKDVEVDILESARAGSESFNDTIDKCDIRIARSVLMPDKIGFSDSGTGTYNQAEQHFGMYLMVLEDLQTDLEEIVNEQVIRPLIDMNYPNVDRYPKYKSNPMTKEDKEKILTSYLSAVDKGVILPIEEDEEHVREQLDFPKRTAESKLLPQKPQPAAVNLNMLNGKNDDKNKDDDMDPDMMKQKQQQKQFNALLPRSLTPYEQKINFAKVMGDIDNVEFNAGLELANILNKAKNDLYSKLVTGNVVESKDLDAVDKLGLNYFDEVRQTWQNYFNKTFRLGGIHAATEVASYVGKQFASADEVGNMPPEKVLEYFTKKAFFITGTMKEEILKNAKSIIYDGIKSGLTNADVMKNLESFFSKYTIIQSVNGQVERAIEDIPGRIETLVRTNMNDAYNQGRLTMFQDPDIEGFIVAYQYSAIIDSRTTSVCRDLDGRIYLASDPIWAQITPPNHFNCRSIMIPIFKGEEFQVSEPPSILPQKGFGGLA